MNLEEGIKALVHFIFSILILTAKNKDIEANV